VRERRSTAHYATFDYGDFRRLMHHVTIRVTFRPAPAL